MRSCRLEHLQSTILLHISTYYEALYRCLNDFNEEPYTIQWTNEAAYDDYPVRCPLNAKCVSSLSDCDILDKLFPVCNGAGRCRADGTCECNYGHSTFLYNDEFSKGVAVPYDASNPAVWGKTNSNWRDYGSKVCSCTVLDCSPPKVCFPGTPSLQLADRHVLCTGASNNGKCAVTAAFCKTAATAATDPIICSGKGILRNLPRLPL